MPILKRFERFREEQEKMAIDIYEAIENRKRILCHAPTGIGKTDASLGAALGYGYENNMTVFFVTPKNSQHKIAIEVVNDICRKFRIDITAVDLCGKRNLCANPNAKDAEAGAFYRICEQLCTKNLCEYFNNSNDNKVFREKSKALGKLMSKNMDSVEFSKLVGDLGLCPYDVTVKNAKNANVIIADYNHVFYPEIQTFLFARAMKRIEDSILIVDEAHNLAQRLTSRLSSSISAKTFKMAFEEAKRFKKSACREVKNLYLYYKEMLLNTLQKKSEVLLDESFFDYYDNDIEKTINVLAEGGEKAIIKTKKKSYLLKLASFLKSWYEKGEYARIGMKKGGKLIKYCLDVRELSKIIGNFHSAVLMSGTLKPVEMHAKILGIENAVFKEYADIFPAENRLVVHCKGFTTRYSKRSENEYEKIADKIAEIVKSVKKKGIVFFPSFEVLESVYEKLKNKNVVAIAQKKRMKLADVRNTLKLFREHGDVMLCVLGGNFSEGIEFREIGIKIVIIVGLPLENMDLAVKERIIYYEKSFGNGIDYAYVAPAMTKVVQACGRLIRSEEDYGAIVFMEDRIAWNNYRKFLPEKLDFLQLTHPEKLMINFFEKKENHCEGGMF